MLTCHCLDCQRSSGAPFASGFIVPVADIAISGTPTTYVHRFCHTGQSVGLSADDGHLDIQCTTMGSVLVRRIPIILCHLRSDGSNGMHRQLLGVVILVKKTCQAH